MMEEIEQLAQLIIQSKKAIVFTGAGISTESGIPDFRSGPAARKTIWEMSVEGGLLTEAEPNLAHHAIAELHQLGKLDCVITQNIDNLHQKAGVPEDKVFELHGNMQWVVCLGCGRRYPMPEVLQRIKEGMEVPDCPDCQGILQPDAVFFGEALPQDTLRGAIRRAQNCDLFIIIGSTLVIYPAAYIPTYATEAGAKLAIVNLTPTPFDHHAAVVTRGKAGEIMSRVMGKVRLS